jgi:hypothetical protein
MAEASARRARRRAPVRARGRRVSRVPRFVRRLMGEAVLGRDHQADRAGHVLGAAAHAAFLAAGEAAAGPRSAVLDNARKPAPRGPWNLCPETATESTSNVVHLERQLAVGLHEVDVHVRLGAARRTSSTSSCSWHSVPSSLWPYISATVRTSWPSASNRVSGARSPWASPAARSRGGAAAPAAACSCAAPGWSLVGHQHATRGRASALPTMPRWSASLPPEVNTTARRRGCRAGTRARPPGPLAGGPKEWELLGLPNSSNWAKPSRSTTWGSGAGGGGEVEVDAGGAGHRASSTNPTPRGQLSLGFCSFVGQIACPLLAAALRSAVEAVALQLLVEGRRGDAEQLGRTRAVAAGRCSTSRMCWRSISSRVADRGFGPMSCPRSADFGAGGAGRSAGCRPARRPTRARAAARARCRASGNR